MLPDETADSAIPFMVAAPRYYRASGVRVTRVMTDNGSAYRAKKFAKRLRRPKIEHPRTRPHTPRTNGKAERFMRTLLREWACAYIYPGPDARSKELPFRVNHYNFHRPHPATEHLPPVSRLGLTVNNVVRNYTQPWCITRG